MAGKVAVLIVLVRRLESYDGASVPQEWPSPGRQGTRHAQIALAAWTLQPRTASGIAEALGNLFVAPTIER